MFFDKKFDVIIILFSPLVGCPDSTEFLNNFLFIFGFLQIKYGVLGLFIFVLECGNYFAKRSLSFLSV